jgi:hypothetical protein
VYLAHEAACVLLADAAVGDDVVEELAAVDVLENQVALVVRLVVHDLDQIHNIGVVHAQQNAPLANE